MLIGYRDILADSNIAPTSGSFDASAPLSNALTRQLAVKAIFPTAGGDMDLLATFDEDKQVGIVAFLAHNFENSYRVGVTLKNQASATIFADELSPVWLPPVDSQFPRNLYFVLPQNFDGVRSIEINVSVSGPADLSFGRIWAGPVWIPATATGRRDFKCRTRDNGVINYSIGQQAYADRKPRFRQLTCSLPVLTEAEAIGTEDGETQNLQDIGFEVGKTDPVIVIPTQRTNQVIHRFGVYGTFMDPPSPDLIEDSSGTETDGLKYSSLFDVIEEL